jgi:peptide-methionine (R)-S-oxide reductase
MISRRAVLMASVAAAVSAGRTAPAFAQPVPAAEPYEITRTDEEWRALLTDAQFDVLRLGMTETPGSSYLLTERRPGMYHCAGCRLPVYSSDHKYNAGTGFLSFWLAEDDAIRTGIDNALDFPRVEVHCRRCASHLGFIFNDGPRWTAFSQFFNRPGKRHSINGVALEFVPG